MKNKLKEWLNKPLKPWDISRESPYFGFEIPDYKDKFFYVWIDAPIGYISIVEEYLKKENLDIYVWAKGSEYKLHQFIGKDVINFHGIYWISELLGFNYQLPESITTHGFLTIDNEKISKSKGNYLAAKDFDLPVESLRYYYASKLSDNISDLNLDTSELKDTYNNKIVGGFINLGSRTAKILEKNFESIIGNEIDQHFINSLNPIIEDILKFYENKNFKEVIQLIEKLIHQSNAYINEQEPWKTVKIDSDRAYIVCSTILNSFFKIALLLEPILPEISKKVYYLFNLDNINFKFLKNDIKNHKIKKYEHLLKRI